jgi:Holliday junction resolvase RusA-like endonuclease
MIRAILDGCTDAGVWRDDAQVVNISARKRYAVFGTGAEFTVSPL